MNVLKHNVKYYYQITGNFCSRLRSESVVESVCFYFTVFKYSLQVAGSWH